MEALATGPMLRQLRLEDVFWLGNPVLRRTVLELVIIQCMALGVSRSRAFLSGCRTSP